MADARRYVYVLKSAGAPARYYVGSTSNPAHRLTAQNKGMCRHTKKHRPWEFHVIIQFDDEGRALAFEKYLKSGSGRAFAKRHFE